MKKLIIFAILILFTNCTKKETETVKERFKDARIELHLETPPAHQYSIIVGHQYDDLTGRTYSKIKSQPFDTVFNFSKQGAEITYLYVNIRMISGDAFNGTARIYKNGTLYKIVDVINNQIKYQYGNHHR